MMEPKIQHDFPLKDKKNVKGRALYIGERIDLRSLETTNRLASSPLVLTTGESGCAVIFRYGVVVVFNVNNIEEAALLDYLKTQLFQPFENPEFEDMEIRIESEKEDGFYGNILYLQNFLSIERLQVIAEILSKSVVLAQYERTVSQNFDQIEPLAISLKQKGHGGSQTQDLLKHIGAALLSQHKMVGRVQVQEKPDILWEHPELERLYIRLEGEYEISERHIALERKIDIISKTLENLLDLVQAKQNLRVEWYIVALIIIEILLTLYQMFFRK